jgi:hypothetical protein
MSLVQHEIDYIADRILAHVSERLVGVIRATIKKEMEIMTDQAIVALTEAEDAILAELALVVTDLSTDAKALADALAGSAASLDPLIAAQTKRLVDGTAAAVAAVAALSPPASPVPSPAPVAA